MRVEYINPFVEASYDILCDIIGANEINRGELYLKNTNTDIMGVAAIIGLAGKVEGRIIMDMEEETALKVASIMNSEKITEFDEIADATIQELANMIGGRAVTTLQEKNYTFDITPPAILHGKSMRISDPNIESLIVPFISTQGKIEINIAIKDKVM